MFCMKCGTQLPDDAVFCFKCGNKMQAVVEEAQIQEVQHPQLKSEELIGTNSVEQVPENGKDAVVKVGEVVNNNDNLQNSSSKEKPKDEKMGFGSILLGLAGLAVGAAVADHQSSIREAIRQTANKYNESDRYFVTGSIPENVMKNALDGYGSALNETSWNLIFIADDSVFGGTGSSGFALTRSSVITSRKIQISYSNIRKIFISLGSDLVVTMNSGENRVIYKFDRSVDDSDMNILNNMLQKVLEGYRSSKNNG